MAPRSEKHSGTSISKSGLEWKAYVVGVIVVVAVVLAAYSLHHVGKTAWEDITFAINPTAERAFAYGETHFDARDPESYDVNRAEKFFRIAAEKDPSLPYVYHELARIAFLWGDYGQALSLINVQIAQHGDEAPNSYYIRALIEGFNGSYEASAADYEHFLKTDPRNWAANNDYAWVLLKANRPRDAAVATAAGLRYSPQNPWLLNTSAIALYELGMVRAAHDQEMLAVKAVMYVTEEDWLRAYPGNDPAAAQAGVISFQNANIGNLRTFSAQLATSTLQ